MAKAKKKKIRVFTRVMSVIALVMLVLFTLFLKKLNVLPNRYFYLIVGVLGFLELIYLIFAFNKRIKIWLLIVLDILFVLIVGLEGYGAYRLNQTYHFIDVGIKIEETTDYYYLVVNKDSKYKETKDIESKIVYYYNDVDDFEKLKQSVSKKVNVILDEVENYSELIEMIDTDKEKIVLINQASYDSILDEQNEPEESTENNDNKQDDKEHIDEKYRILDKIELVKKVEKKESKEDITKKTFIIYLSGIDTKSNKMPSRSLSDVNMFLVVNPQTRKILMVNVPRDYYVQLHGKEGLKDKLTHAGMNGGIKLSKATMEDLLEHEADYYVRVNFNAVIKLVDAVGGLTINNDVNYSFRCWTDEGCVIKPGKQKVNGRCALAFARERHAYQNGDIHRGENQQQVIQLLVDKLGSSKSLLTNYDKILSSLNNSLETDLSTENITSLIQFQINDMRGWEFETANLSGSDGMNKTYSFPKMNLYVMIPNQDSIENAKKKIDEYLGDNSSYDLVDNKTNND